MGDESHDLLVREVQEIEQFYAGQLETPYRNMLRYHRLYLADRDDKRKPHEKWRANTVIPYAYSGTETKVAALSDIFHSADPPVQAEGIGGEDEQRARKIERLYSYQLEKNSWPLNLDMQLRQTVIQGTAAWKLIHVDRSRMVRMHSTPEQVQAFLKSIDEAVTAGAPPPPATEDLGAFDEWRTNVNLAKYGEVPERPWVPMPGEPDYEFRRVTEYRGPWFEPVSMFDLRFDPMIEDLQSQPIIIHRIVKPGRWLDQRTGPGPDKIFDPGQVEAGMSGYDGRRFSDFEEQIAGWLGISRFNGEDPIYRQGVELWEVWRPGTDAPYCVVLNRKAIINKRPDVHPYWHGMHPFVFTRNTPLRGRALGLSDFQQTEKLYHHLNAFHDLLMDATLLAVLPMFAKLRDVGVPELQRFLRPGGILEIANPDGIKAVTKFDAGLQHAFGAIAGLKDNVDESNATQPNVRGSVSTIGRVSATEAQGRLNQALMRQKQHVIRLESELTPLARMSMMLWHQFEPAEMTMRVGGDDTVKNPFVDYSPEDFMWALDMDFRFRGATKALNRDLTAQQLKDVLVNASNLQLLLPQEGRKIITKILETLGHKGVAAIITAAGDAEIKQLREIQVATVKAQAAAQIQAMIQAKLQSVPVPNEVGVGEEDGGGEPPAPPMGGEGAPPPEAAAA